MKKYIILFIIVLCSPAWAETIHLNDGRVIEGKIIEKTAKSIRVDIDGGLGRMTYYFDEIADIDGQKLQVDLPVNPVAAQTLKSVQQPVNPHGDELTRVEGFLKKDDCDSAMPILNKIIKAGSNNYYVYSARGYCLDKKDDYDAALKDYFKSTELNSEEEKKAYYSIAGLYFRKNEFIEAITQYKKYLTYFPNDGVAIYWLAYADFKIGLYDESLNYISKASSLGVNDTEHLKEQIGQMQYQEKGKLLQGQNQSQNNSPENAEVPMMAQGEIHGLPFIVERSKIQDDGAEGGNVYVLSLIQGKDSSPDLAVRIILHCPSNISLENFQNNHIQIANGNLLPSMSGTPLHGVTIDAEWKVEGQDRPAKRTYMDGEFNLDLSFGEIHNGKIQGEINLRLPDEQGNHVEGTFEALVERNPFDLFRGAPGDKSLIWEIIGLLYFCFWVWMGIECSGSSSGLIWLLIIIIVPFGPVIYFFIERQKLPKG